MVNRSANELVEEATGNVKKKHLTKDSGIVRTYLYDEPLIEHLNDGEQPEYVFSHDNKGYRITAQDGDERTPHHDSTEGKRYLLITDQRLLCVAGCKDGDETIEHTYHEIINIERVGGNRYGGPYPGFKFVSVDGDSYKFIPSFNSKDLVKGAVEYISNQIVETKSESNSPNTHEATEEISSKSPIQEKLGGMSNLSSSDIRNILQLDGFDRGDETFHYAHGINAVYDDGDQVGGKGGCILATDSRLISYVTGTFGSANFSMDYDKIHTVEIKHGKVSWDRISVQSDSKTYGFAGFEDVDKSEIHEFADFIRDKSSEPEIDVTSESNIEPTEQLKNIKELHENDVITDEEFENKKQSLLDRI